MTTRVLVLAAALAPAACGEPADGAPTAEQGRALADDPALGGNPDNPYRCTTCHALREDPADPLIRPGAPLGGAVLRQSWWGNDTVDLLEAINFCISYMMQAEPLAPGSTEARALLTWLRSISDAGPTEPWPVTVPADPDRPAGGDPAAGERLYGRACFDCHGERGDGAGRLAASVPPLPEYVVQEHGEAFGCEQYETALACGNQEACSFEGGACRPTYGPDDAIGDKVRHGRFLGFGGTMPFFCQEVLPDRPLAHVTAWLLDPAAATAR